MKKYSKIFTADFETNNSEDECRVWAYALCEIGNFDNLIVGNNIKDFITFLANKKENYLVLFHNLKFDGNFIISYLLQNDYKVIKKDEEIKDKTFKCLINGMGAFYSIEIFFTKKGHKTNKVTIYDSLKLIPFSVEKIANDFKLPIKKGSIDYNLIREENHDITQEEYEYIKNDVEIMARAITGFYALGINKMTIGSCAFNYYKKITSNFNNYFPKFSYEQYEFLKNAYKGGFTYLNPIYKEKEVDSGIVLDVNSLYPFTMREKVLPFQDGIFFQGEYEKDDLYNLYIQQFSCMFELKKGKIPTIQIKNSIHFLSNEYQESSHNEIVTLTLTNIDLQLFKENYDIYELNYNCGMKFKSVKGLFNNYVDYWYTEKDKAKKEGNSVMYACSKLLLNSLYGKFGKNARIESKYPILDEEGIVRYKNYEAEETESEYIPLACFITSYARETTIRASQKIRDYSIKKYGVDKYIYSDTDSIHTSITSSEELKDILEIDDYKLGAWKHESSFKRAKFLRQKCYIEQMNDDTLKVTVAGLPHKLHHIINFDNFCSGFSTENIDKRLLDGKSKLRYKNVKNGVVLKETPFTIK